MRGFLKELYQKNKRDFDIWNYLWLFAENNSIDFSYVDLQNRFNIPTSSLHRVLNSYPESWNTDKTYVEFSKVAPKQYNVTFYPKGKKESKAEVFTVYDELFEWLKEYYNDLEYEYTDMHKHKRYVKTICGKLTKAMKKRGTDVTDELLKSTFKYVFLNIGDWWKDTGNITLTLVSKHFTKILNQVKSNGNSKKSDSYSKAAAQVDEIDFSQLTRK